MIEIPWRLTATEESVIGVAFSQDTLANLDEDDESFVIFKGRFFSICRPIVTFLIRRLLFGRRIGISFLSHGFRYGNAYIYSSSIMGHQMYRDDFPPSWIK